MLVPPATAPTGPKAISKRRDNWTEPKLEQLAILWVVTSTWPEFSNNKTGDVFFHNISPSFQFSLHHNALREDVQGPLSSSLFSKFVYCVVPHSNLIHLQMVYFESSSIEVFRNLRLFGTWSPIRLVSWYLDSRCNDGLPIWDENIIQTSCCLEETLAQTKVGCKPHQLTHPSPSSTPPDLLPPPQVTEGDSPLSTSANKRA